MAHRPKGYGMTAELQRKKEGKYDPDLEVLVRQWMQAVVGEPLAKQDTGIDSFHLSLKDGTYLCKLANKLRPGSIKKVDSSKMAFKMMENIGNFLTFTESYGVSRIDMFQTVDLYEKQNIPLVITAIHALGRKAQAKGFQGPSLGPKEATANKREFSEEQLNAGQEVIGLQMGSNQGPSQASGTPYGLGRQIDGSSSYK